MRVPRASRRRGVTLIELLIALVVGGIVLASATGVLLSNMRQLASAHARDDADRSARYLGVVLHRDLQEAGVELESSLRFGSVAAWDDHLAVLRVPFEPDVAPTYRMATNGPNEADPPPGSGNCGPNCVRVDVPAGGISLEPGDLALLLVETERRLVLVRDVSRQGNGTAQVRFADVPDRLLRHPTNLERGLRLRPGRTFLQELAMALYWRDGDRLLRATRFTADGRPVGELLATGIDSFTVRLRFVDGREAAEALPEDGDAGNDYDDLAAVRVRAVFAPSEPLPGGADLPPRRAHEWWVAPRNLHYERNPVD
jgi:prepilin-type N-terminal cleavage/methylation domain-containing protein